MVSLPLSPLAEQDNLYQKKCQAPRQNSQSLLAGDITSSEVLALYGTLIVLVKLW